ncbi:hypothetical protein F2Q68_00010200 [Brassica cretica]|uniref:Inosine/uridine-preferring nucleoside hydrolase domain-containing protein n=1 Tax=Brassica cretica TaxID=69181 RepID=A0A8S9KYE7_BRACR|nr:hypothetical protein F2Q68_00010200 [Brassica cretica]
MITESSSCFYSAITRSLPMILSCPFDRYHPIPDSSIPSRSPFSPNTLMKTFPMKSCSSAYVQSIPLSNSSKSVFPLSSGVYLHDPVSFVAVVRPDLFTYKKGVVRVETQGICVGHTLMDQGLKRWNGSNPWVGYSPVSVAWTVDVDGVLEYIKGMLMKP